MSPVALHHEVHGTSDGAATLLLGGSLGTSLGMWAPQVDALSVDRRIVAFDHRGHGASPVPPGPYTIAELGGDVLALIDALALERVDYCGLSVGGMVGQWLAVNAPERIGRLVLLCSSPDTLNPNAFTERARAVRAAGATEPIADAVVANWFTEAWTAAHPAQVARHRQMIVDTPVEGYAGCAEAVAGHDVTAGLSSVTAPTLVVGAAQDRAIPATQSERIAAAIPAARLVILDPAAHIASVERPDAVTELIVEHLSSPDEGRP